MKKKLFFKIIPILLIIFGLVGCSSSNNILQDNSNQKSEDKYTTDYLHKIQVEKDNRIADEISDLFKSQNEIKTDLIMMSSVNSYTIKINLPEKNGLSEVGFIYAFTISGNYFNLDVSDVTRYVITDIYNDSNTNTKKVVVEDRHTTTNGGTLFLISIHLPVKESIDTIPLNKGKFGTDSNATLN